MILRSVMKVGYTLSHERHVSARLRISQGDAHMEPFIGQAQLFTFNFAQIDGQRVKGNCFPSTRTGHFIRSSAQPSAAMVSTLLPYLICVGKPRVTALLTT